MFAIITKKCQIIVFFPNCCDKHFFIIFKTNPSILFFKISESNIESIENHIEHVRSLLITNKISFDSAAVIYSDAPDAKTNKGRIHRIPKNQIQQQIFLSVLDTINVGMVSSVFKTEMGYHILKLNGVYDDSWITIEQWALEYKKTRLYEEWLQKLRSKFNIEMRIGS